ncbi:hypothetical protein E8E11_001773 [Didymella keratinophila]|nr:hypothetical protein E8E11_001773 [Didymella keratinophila]
MDEELNDALKDGFLIPAMPRIDSASETSDYEDAHTDDDAEDTAYTLEPSRLSTDLEHAYDLSPPPPTNTDRRAETIAEQLFSVEHLNVILKDKAQLQRFTTFLMRYRAHCVPTLRALDELVAEALPAYVTFGVVDVVTELLNKEILGRNTPVMRELVRGLAEVYCLSDPTQEGNPIVFASEEFYNATQYGRGYAIGKACRFLHGPKTDKCAIERMDKAVQAQQEVAETMVMVSPLRDNKGGVRYFIGARIDVKQLIDGGKTMDSFHQLLTGNRPVTPVVDPLENRPTLKALRDFGDLLNDEEKGSMRDSEMMRTDSRPSTPTARAPNSPIQRRFLGIEERISQDGLRSQYAGQIPGVYQNYILVRPYPSLRITLTSPSLRIPGLCQSKLDDHIGGPEHVRNSLIEALAQGIGVTAKVSWLTRVSRPSTSLSISQLSDDASIRTSDNIVEGKARWIHCTPLTGSDGKVGVIMIIMVDKQDSLKSLPGMSSLPSMRSAGTIGPAPRSRAKSHASFRSETTTPERWTPRQRDSPESVIKERPSAEESRKSMDITVGHCLTRSDSRGEVRSPTTTTDTRTSHRRAGSRLYADWMKELREAQKRVDSFSTRLREQEVHDHALGSMARAVEVKAVNARGRTKKIGGTF